MNPKITKTIIHITIIILSNLGLKELLTTQFQLPYWKTIIITSFITIFTIEYISNKYLLHRGITTKNKLLKESLYYSIFSIIEVIIVSAITLLTSHYFIYKLMGTADFHPNKIEPIRNYSFLFGVLVGILWSYFINKYIVFKKKKEEIKS